MSVYFVGPKAASKASEKQSLPQERQTKPYLGGKLDYRPGNNGATVRRFELAVEARPVCAVARAVVRPLAHTPRS
jgi:hypothetical protein